MTNNKITDNREDTKQGNRKGARIYYSLAIMLLVALVLVAEQKYSLYSHVILYFQKAMNHSESLDMVDSKQQYVLQANKKPKANIVDDMSSSMYATDPGFTLRLEKESKTNTEDLFGYLDSKFSYFNDKLEQLDKQLLSIRKLYDSLAEKSIAITSGTNISSDNYHQLQDFVLLYDKFVNFEPFTEEWDRLYQYNDVFVNTNLVAVKDISQFGLKDFNKESKQLLVNKINKIIRDKQRKSKDSFYFYDLISVTNIHEKNERYNLLLQYVKHQRYELALETLKTMITDDSNNLREYYNMLYEYVEARNAIRNIAKYLSEKYYE